MRHWEYLNVTLVKSGKEWAVYKIDGPLHQEWGDMKFALNSFCNLMDEASWELITATQARGDTMTLFFRRRIE